MKIDLENLDREESFEIKLQISLIKNAERMMPYYKEKNVKFEEYIKERIEKIKKILKEEHAEIYENGKMIFNY